MADEQQSEFLTVTEVAKLLHVGRSKVYEMMDKGQLPFLKLGAALRIARSAVVALVERCTVTGGKRQMRLLESERSGGDA